MRRAPSSIARLELGNSFPLQSREFLVPPSIHQWYRILGARRVRDTHLTLFPILNHRTNQFSLMNLRLIQGCPIAKALSYLIAFPNILIRMTKQIWQLLCVTAKYQKTTTEDRKRLVGQSACLCFRTTIGGESQSGDCGSISGLFFG